jgi:hypothetical protein
MQSMQSPIKRSSSLIALALLCALALQTMPAAAAPFDGTRLAFADARFADAWSRTDAETVRGGRSWYWGPAPWFDYAEFYREGENGLRTVQYFDKARMELNNPNDRSGPYQGVTNGLLVKELVSGHMQLGNNPYDYDQRGAADVPVAGNPRAANVAAPGYSVFAAVATLDNDYRDPQRLNQRISTTIDRGGNLGVREDLALPETEIVQYNTVTGHNIPRVFWDFLGLQGRIDVGGRITTGPVVDWLFAVGLPITDAYWTRAQIGAVEQDVLVQLFERRVLTYVPSNPAGYQVEMGNVGQHYFQWRYPHLGQPWAAPDPEPPLVFATDAGSGDHWEVALYRSTGTVGLTQNDAETVAYSYRRSWDPSQLRLLSDSRRSNPEYRQVYELDPPIIYGGEHSDNAWARRISFSDGALPPPYGPYPGYLPTGVANDYNPAYSPDGTKIIMVSDRWGTPDLFIMPPIGNSPNQLTNNGCVNESPTWSPDGRVIYWVNNCDGDFEIYRAEIAYNYEGYWGVDAQLVNMTQLTDNSSDDRFARVSPDGETIAFSSNRDGNYEVYLIDASDGGNVRRLTTNSAHDDSPTWSADGRQLAFASDRDGDFEIYRLRLSDEALTQLTFNDAQDRWPLWAQ